MALSCSSAAGQVHQMRGKVPLTFAPQSRPVSLAALRAVLAEKPGVNNDQMLKRVKAECLNQLRFYEQRDAAYAELAKP